MNCVWEQENFFSAGETVTWNILVLMQFLLYWMLFPHIMSGLTLQRSTEKPGEYFVFVIMRKVILKHPNSSVKPYF